jgi:hypothetical protein
MANVANSMQIAPYLRFINAGALTRTYVELRWFRQIVAISYVVIFAWTVGWSTTAQSAEDVAVIEYRVKAAFLYKFAGYVSWPPAAFVRPDTPVTIAVMGAEKLAAELEQAVIGRTVSDRMVVVKRINSGDSLNGVHALFVGKTEAGRLTQLVQLAQARSILTVTESEGALRQGSTINFTVAAQRVRFEISLDSAEKSGLKLSSQLLAVAQQVITGAP